MPAVSEKQRRFMAMIHAAKKAHKSKELSGKARKAAEGMTASQAHDFMYKVEAPEEEVNKEAAYKEARMRKARRILVSLQLPKKDYINKVQSDPIKPKKQVKADALEEAEEAETKDAETKEEVTKEAALKGFAKMVVNLQMRKD